MMLEIYVGMFVYVCVFSFLREVLCGFISCVFSMVVFPLCYCDFGSII